MLQVGGQYAVWTSQGGKRYRYVYIYLGVWEALRRYNPAW